MSRLRIGTRGSALALWQAEAVARALEARGAATEIVRIKTSGDRLQETPDVPSATKGVFVKEIEDALLQGEIDIAVHSAKDMSAALPDGLAIAAVLPREDPRDALVLPPGRGAAPVRRIATSSVRRIAQLSRIYPDATFLPIRGNVDTRLRKLDAGEADALVLASAGLIRLGHGSRISRPLSIEDCTPAPGQGIVAIEVRGDHRAAHQAAASIGDRVASQAFTAERSLVAALGGGCQLPLGALAVVEGSSLEMRAVVLSPDGGERLDEHARGHAGDPAGLGEAVADALLKAGARRILDAIG